VAGVCLRAFGDAVLASMQSESRENQLARVTGQATTKINFNHHAAKQHVFL
jgi:hypothetical protein